MSWSNRMIVARLLVGAAVLAGISGEARADVVDDWNQIALQTFRETAGGPGFMARTAAMMHSAMYDVLNSMDPEHEPIVAYVRPRKNTGRDVAVAQAAHDVLVSIYPTRKRIYDRALRRTMDAQPDGARENNAVALGSAIAQRVIASRSGDGMLDTVEYRFVPRPGSYVLTEPDVNSKVVGTQYPYVRPWVLTSGSQFRSPGPAGFKRADRLLQSAEYAEAFDEVKSLGARNSTTRTAEQTEIAWFWANDRAGTYHPPGQLLQATQDIANTQGVRMPDKARLLAIVSVAMTDTAIAVWDRKLQTNLDLWRPVTAIHHADIDNNPLTDADPDWQPLLEFSPPFPAFPSGHAAFAAAHAEIMAQFFGTDEMTFTLTTDEPIVHDVTRSFTSFSGAARENGLSRVYLGVHYRFDADTSFSLGSTIGHYIYERLAAPLCPGDMNSDGGVDSSDMAEFTSLYFADDGRADMNKDGDVNYADMVEYIDNYLVGCRKLG